MQHKVTRPGMYQTKLQYHYLMRATGQIATWPRPQVTTHNLALAASPNL